MWTHPLAEIIHRGAPTSSSVIGPPSIVPWVFDGEGKWPSKEGGTLTQGMGSLLRQVPELPSPERSPMSCCQNVILLYYGVEGHPFDPLALPCILFSSFRGLPKLAECC